MKQLIKQILRESVEEKFIKTIVSRIKPPYFKNLNKFEVSKDERKKIFKKLFDKDVTIEHNTISDNTGNKLYHEYPDGEWVKTEYDENGNQIYREYSDGYWDKWGYNERGNIIYYENSRDGVLMDKR